MKKKSRVMETIRVTMMKPKFAQRQTICVVINVIVKFIFSYVLVFVCNCTLSIFFYQGDVRLIISDEDNDDEECRLSHQPKQTNETNRVGIPETRSNSNYIYEPNGQFIELQFFFISFSDFRVISHFFNYYR